MYWYIYIFFLLYLCFFCYICVFSDILDVYLTMYVVIWIYALYVCFIIHFSLWQSEHIKERMKLYFLYHIILKQFQLVCKFDIGAVSQGPWVKTITSKLHTEIKWLHSKRYLFFEGKSKTYYSFQNSFPFSQCFFPFSQWFFPSPSGLLTSSVTFFSVFVHNPLPLSLSYFTFLLLFHVSPLSLFSWCIFFLLPHSLVIILYIY